VSESTTTGILYVVATPIGNLGDMTPRAREVLGDVDLIACEDTRHSRPLLRHFGIDRPVTAYHEHNEAEQTPRLIARLRGGRVHRADQRRRHAAGQRSRLRAGARRPGGGIRVVPVPGVSAPICALSASGLPSDRFLFLGFPPRGEAARKRWIADCAAEPGTLILFEAGRRIAATLADLAEVLGPRRAVLARELTKRFETLLDDELPALVERVQADRAELGECVILVAGRPIRARRGQRRGPARARHPLGGDCP
jgi:16S rRNA (cytidine1402-2'-O)-methyltransferase